MKIAEIKKCYNCKNLHLIRQNNKEVWTCDANNSIINDRYVLNSNCPYKGMADKYSENCFNGLCPMCEKPISTDFLCNLTDLKYGDFTLTAHLKHLECDTEWDVEIKCIDGEMIFEVTNIREIGEILINDISKPLDFERESFLICPVCSTSNVKLNNLFDPDKSVPMKWRKICIMKMGCEHGHSWDICTESDLRTGKTSMSLVDVYSRRNGNDPAYR